MKKRLFCMLVLCSLALSGCGKVSDKDILNKFETNVNNAKSYYLEGKLDIVNNEDIYTYDVKVSYQKEDNYKVDLTNTVNSHQQIILRNNDGVYVISPKINKSFKFQSDWPYNNSQVYLLSSLMEDINNDSNRTYEKSNDGYIFTSSVNYPNNEKLVKQKVFFGKDYLPTKVEVLDSDGNSQIKMIFDKIDLRTEFNDTYFDLNSILTTNEEPKAETKNEDENNSNVNQNQEPNSDTNTSNTKQTATIDDVIYPMYLPANTYLSKQERVNTEDGERLILTFTGDSPFVLMEQIANYSDVPEIIPTYGRPELIGASLAVINDNSANWFDNGIEYYIVSDVMKSEELIQVVKSISVLPVSK